MNLYRFLHISWNFGAGLVFLLLAGYPGFAQKDLRQANALFSQEKYAEAIQFYSKHLNLYADQEALLKRGKCYYHSNQLEAAIQDFDRAQLLQSNDPDADFYLGRCYHQLLDFEQAIIYYKKFMSWHLEDEFIREKITEDIKNCASGIRLSYLPPVFSVYNFGSPVNTPSNELNIIQSPSHLNKYYFSRSSDGDPSRYSVRVYEIREAVLEETGWLNPRHQAVNELISDISPDGQLLYLSRYDSKGKRSGLWVDWYEPGKTPLSNLQRFEGPVSYEKGDRDLFVIDDSTYLFSTNRLEGYGGYDLFLTGFRKGYWFKPVNLGPGINTRFDEITPSTSLDDTYIFFSSNRLESVGGFDIFYCQLDSTNLEWSEALNAGLPLNSAADDINFRFSTDGSAAVFASDRKTDGFGRFDVYHAVVDHTTDLFSSSFPFISIVLGNAGIKPVDSVSERYRQKERPVASDVSNNIAIVNEPEENVFEKEIAEKADSVTIHSEVLLDLSGIKDTLFLQPYYYNPDTPLLEQEEVKTYLKRIGDVMLRHPGVSLTITGHCSPGEKRQSDLFQTISLVEPLVDFMVAEGVAPDHIRILGAGSELPIAKNALGERLLAASRKFNNRIEFNLDGTVSWLQIQKVSPFVVQHIRSDQWYIYQTLIHGLSYTLNVIGDMDSKKEIDLAFPDPWLVEKDFFRNQYQFSCGIFKTYAQARAARNRLPGGLTAETQIGVLIDGLPVLPKDLLSYAKDYTDLINYLAD